MIFNLLLLGFFPSWDNYIPKMTTTEKMIQRIELEANRKSIFQGRTPEERRDIMIQKKAYLKYAEILKMVIE